MELEATNTSTSLLVFVRIILLGDLRVLEALPRPAFLVGLLSTQFPVPIGPVVFVGGRLSVWGSSKLISILPELNTYVVTVPTNCGISVSNYVAGVIYVYGELITHFIEQISAALYVGGTFFFETIVLSGLLCLNRNKR